MNIFIDPRSTINYSSFYISGLYELFGKEKVCFSPRYFNELEDIDMLLAFVVQSNSISKKYIVDYRDTVDLIEGAYHWSDSYAKINVDNSINCDKYSKLILIPPSFAIRIWNPLELSYYLITNLISAKIYKNNNHKNIHLQPKRWIRNYLSLLKRQRLENYQTKDNLNDKNYVFFVSTFWQGGHGVNANRQHYILSCANHNKIQFDGGFFIDKNVEPPTNIQSSLFFHHYLPNREYLKRIKKSIFVFNTPALHNCHGWKLGEYLCMGKAIISTPLTNRLVMPLEHGKDILIASNNNEIEQAIEQLIEDKELRHRLEHNTRQYYDNYASPIKVIERIVALTL